MYVSVCRIVAVGLSTTLDKSIFFQVLLPRAWMNISFVIAGCWPLGGTPWDPMRLVGSPQGTPVSKMQTQKNLCAWFIFCFFGWAINWELNQHVGLEKLHGIEKLWRCYGHLTEVAATFPRGLPAIMPRDFSNMYAHVHTFTYTSRHV